MDVPWDAWAAPLMGTYLFRLTWGAQSCASAMPPVATQRLDVLVDGHSYGGTTDSGQLVDGSDSKPCRPLEESTPQSIAGMPVGPVNLTVFGEDGSGAVRYQRTFDSFVGAGSDNPVIVIDTPLTN